MVMIENVPSIVFLWSYMAIIWGNLIQIWIQKPKNPSKSWKYLFNAFFLLAFGDIFHLLPRTYLWYQYSIKGQADIYTSSMGVLIYGAGLIITGISMTFFYLLFYLFWKETYSTKEEIVNLKSLGQNTKTLDAIAYISVIVRIILILLPWNQYGAEPIYYYTIFSFRLLTNLPLYIIGIEVLYLFIKSYNLTKKSNSVHPEINRAVKNSAIWIIVSFLTYTGTLLGVHLIPLLGMLMIPKTIAYIIVLYYMKKCILLNPDVE
ncbi:hypothetical protein [Candidatus Harpocratesius sp.]